MGIGSVFRQEAFLGKNRKKDFFEGWYYKIIDRQKKCVLAVIPGIAIGKSKKDAHAFIQVIDAVSGKAAYHRFPLEAFIADTRKLAIEIGPNRFTNRGIHLELCADAGKIAGELAFSQIIPYPKTLLCPGIMGPFSYIPRMECYHGIVNIRHTIQGSLTIDGVQMDFSEGEGYLEKDWGKSFPNKWIWVQANHFEEPACFMFSLAQIPFMGRSFTGLICFLKTEREFFRFATYNASRIQSLVVTNDRLEAVIQKRGYSLHLLADNAEGGILKAPKNGLMERDIAESVMAKVLVRLRTPKGILFEGQSGSAGMEVVNWPQEK